ncbi:MAG: outer membrane beta-barrel protein [Proteobacteria bacterium]|nr:outer membrane beta-barrel protein [Pseudomonadota bacterium]
MRLAFVGLLLAASTSPVLAEGRFSAGLGLGLTQSAVDAGADANHTLNLFGRVQLTNRLAGQLEVTRIATEDGSGTDLRAVAGVVVFDLGRGRVVPTILAGLGIDNETNAYQDTDYTNAFLGLGLEYRAPNGLTVGADLRMGSRTADAQPVYTGNPVPGTLARTAPSSLSDGEYRAARVTVGVRF